MDDGVPEADGDQPDLVVGEEPPEIQPPQALGERPEADVLEQTTLVRADQAVRRPVIRDDVPEADAWEQSIEEPIDEDDRF